MQKWWLRAPSPACPSEAGEARACRCALQQRNLWAAGEISLRERGLLGE